MRRLIAFAPLAVLAACAPDTAPPVPDTCNATGYAGLVGAPLAAVTLPADLDDRIIGPDTAVTLDFRPERINFVVDDNDVITEVRCG